MPEIVDILVVGSGAGGLTAALAAHDAGCSAMVIEKSSLVGGASAMSGGAIWIPGNHHVAAAGTPDSLDDAERYLAALASSDVDPGAISAFVRNAPEMLRWLEQATPLRAVPAPYPDFHPELHGASPGLRTLQVVDLDGTELGKWLNRLRPSSAAVTLLGHIAMSPMESGLMLVRPPGWKATLRKVLMRYATQFPQRLLSRRDRFLTLGNALVGRLLLGAVQRGIPILRNVSLKELQVVDGRVTGAFVERDGRREEILARCGVILAAGGFEHDPAERARYLPGSPDDSASATPVTNSGDALRAAQAAGADVRDRQAAWWAPVFIEAGAKFARFCTIESSLPGVVVVDSSGRQFGASAGSYHDFALAMARRRVENPQERWFLVFGKEARNRYPVGPLIPFVPYALQRGAQSVVKCASTLSSLAKATGIDFQGIGDTVAEWDKAVTAGTAKAKIPGMSQLSIMPGPFYAAEIHPGDLGTCGGLATNGDAAVLDCEGRPILGLYAIGNSAATITPRSLPALGAILGPAMTFGFIAARHASSMR